jgi:hypothetical protein
MTTCASFPAELGRADRKTGDKLNVMLLYDSIDGATRAAQFIASLASRETDGLAIELSPLSFSTLGDATLSALATTDVQNADLIVITMSGSARFLPVSVENWLTHYLALRREARLAVVALFVRDERPDSADSLRLRTVKSIVEESGGSFFAPMAMLEESRKLEPSPSFDASTTGTE